MTGPYETRRCDWCDQPLADCDCELDDLLDAGYPRSGGERDGDGWWWDNRTVVTIDTGGLL